MPTEPHQSHSSHKPVLLNEVLEYLNPQPGDFMIDGTMDGGGHATAIMEKGSRLLGVDWDERMVARWHAKKIDSRKAIFAHGNYADLPEILVNEKLPLADGLLIDLGLSSEQLDAKSAERDREADEHAGRGFSFSEAAANEPLLMTYDDSQTPVREILREIDEMTLANIIYEFGGERGSRRIAKAIKEYERRKPIMTAGELATTIRSVLPKSYERGRIDPATRTFQALRIYANDELKNIKKLLDEVGEGKIIKPGGRVVILSFHSLEDRIVKQSFQKLAKENKAKLLTKKPIPATREEIKENPRARSAKLRAMQLL
jgi:16S rRNA (cytosine1402-N4)-methyltransferase